MKRAGGNFFLGLKKKLEGEREVHTAHNNAD